MNNFEKIKQMTVDEMVNFLKDYEFCFTCFECPYHDENCAGLDVNCDQMEELYLKKWLLSEVEE